MEQGLKDEIRQTKPFVSEEEEAYLNLLRTAALLEHSLAENVKPFGVTPTQYNVLRILRGAGDPGLCRNELTDRMVTPVPDATRLLDRLEQAGYVARSREGADRRFVTARITESGRELLARMEEPIHDLHQRQLGHLQKDELEALSRLLTRARRTGT